MANAMYIIDDGIEAWFEGPEWDEVTAEVFRDFAPEIEATAKSNAPWEDRTGDARAGLRASVENQDGLVVLSLSHSVSYGRWLETIQNGRFAILIPTLEEYHRQVAAEVARRVGRARKGNR